MKVIINAVFLISFVVVKSSAQSLFNDPPKYFGGGQDNDPYLDWVSDQEDSYDRSVFLASLSKPEQGVAVHWRIKDDHIHLAVAAKAKGWVGFGFSENGGMHGSDLVYLEAYKPNTLNDAYVLKDTQPLMDDCQSWNLTNFFVGGGFLIFEANRLLDTDDHQDRVIMPSTLPSDVTSPVIAAWGDSPVLTYHGPDNRARGQMHWYSTIETDQTGSFQEDMTEKADGSFVHRAQDYSISTEETQYVAFCISREELIAQGVPMNATSLYLVGFEPIIDPRAQAYVHHFVVTSSTQNEFEPCMATATIEAAAAIEEGGVGPVYAWAPGEPPLSFPEKVALPFGDNASAKSLRMVIHYDNPQGIDNILDSSGVRYYYSTEPVEHEVGTLVLGDPFVALRGEALGGALTLHTFECPSSCSTFVLDEPVTVLREYLHMHKSGISGRNEVIRNGEVIQTAQVDFFDFKQQGMQAVQQESYQLYPGDAFRLTCEYDSTSGRLFGLGSDEEMCMHQVLYYPKKTIFNTFPWACAYDNPLPACAATYDTRALENEQFLGRAFGIGMNNDSVCLNEAFEETVDGDNGNGDEESDISDAQQSANFIVFYTMALFAGGWMML